MKVIAPRQIWETRRPVLPRVLYCMNCPLSRVGRRLGYWTLEWGGTTQGSDVVDLAAMADGDDENYKAVLFQFADDPVIAYTIAPKSQEIMAESVAVRFGIDRRDNTGFKVSSDFALDGFIQF